METARPDRPNILLILTDDQGWGDLGRTGNDQIRTPELDRLGSEGAVFTWFYVQPLCAPTRAELLTGRSFPKTGVKGVTLGAERVNLTERTLADHLKAAGYATGCFGKWHSGMQYPYHPTGRGFDTFYGFCCGHWSHYFDSTVESDGEEVVAPGYLPDALTERAMAFMEHHRDRPFFCYVPLNTPHSPFQVPDRWYEPFKDRAITRPATHPEKENPEVTRAALAMVENIDWNVGRLRARLSELGLERNTVVIFLSDNGPNGWRWNGGMEGIKGSCHEGGVRSPLSITWPGTIPAGKVIHQVGGAIDLLPTCLDLAGVARSGGWEPDGISLKPFLVGGEKTPPMERLLFAQECRGATRADGSHFTGASVRTARFRMHETGALYEIESDPGETKDVSHAFPGEAERLGGVLRQWRANLPKGAADPVLPLGYGGHCHSDFPAQDAHLQGDVTFSSIHPNCSWLTGWTDPKASAIWELEVYTAGSYAVTLQVSSKAEQTGSRFTLSALGRSLEIPVDLVFDEPMRTGMDRVPRTESYDKPFAALRAGNLDLPVGRHRLELSWSHAVSATAPEVKGLRLTRVGG